MPRKNVRIIAGHPLIAWTIADARRARLISRTIVSTEDEEIAAISRKYGAETLKRPLELAGDSATTRDALLHAANSLDPSPSIVVLLQATSPIRRPGLVDKAIEAFLSGDFDPWPPGPWSSSIPPTGWSTGGRTSARFSSTTEASS